jgi:hypothetical protein
MLKNVHKGLVDPQLPFITGEAYYHLSDHVNSQITWSCGDKKMTPVFTRFIT